MVRFGEKPETLTAVRGICNFNIVKRRKRPENCSPGEINRVVQGGEKGSRGRWKGREEFLILLLFFVTASNTLFLLLLLVLHRRIEIRFSIGRQLCFKTTHAKSLLLFFSSDFISGSLVDIWLQEPRVSPRGLESWGTIAPFSPPHPSPSIWLPTTFQSHLHVYKFFFSRSAQRGQRGSPENHALTETGIGVLSLDPLSPVLGEEHVGRQRPFGRASVLLAFGRLHRLFGLLQNAKQSVSERRTEQGIN